MIKALRNLTDNVPAGEKLPRTRLTPGDTDSTASLTAHSTLEILLWIALAMFAASFGVGAVVIVAWKHKRKSVEGIYSFQC